MILYYKFITVIKEIRSQLDQMLNVWVGSGYSLGIVHSFSELLYDWVIWEKELNKCLNIYLYV